MPLRPSLALVLLAGGILAVLLVSLPGGGWSFAQATPDSEALTSTAIVTEATARAVTVEAETGAGAQGAGAGLGSLALTATALAGDLYTPLPFDVLTGSAPQVAPGGDTGSEHSGDETSIDWAPLVVIGGALLVMIAAGALARSQARAGRGTSPGDDSPTD